jgi:hypothetical protein
MSKPTVPHPNGGSQGRAGTSKGHRGKGSHGRSGEKATSLPPDGQGGLARAQPTPLRPVVSLALVLFVPAMWLVWHGNLSVQTALERFIGALVVSWVAARLVLATVSSFAGSVSSAEAAAGPVLTGGSGPGPILGSPDQT